MQVRAAWQGKIRVAAALCRSMRIAVEASVLDSMLQWMTLWPHADTGEPNTCV